MGKCADPVCPACHPDNPIPGDLRVTLSALLVPQTVNMKAGHGEVMECLAVAYPAIRDWLREHPDSLRSA